MGGRSYDWQQEASSRKPPALRLQPLWLGHCARQHFPLCIDRRYTMTTSVMDFVHGLKSSAARVEHGDPLRLVRRMLAHYGLEQLYEWYKASTIGKVVFDVDGSASKTTASVLLATALAAVAAFFDGIMPERVLIAAAHGGDKLSYRLFVPGYRMRMSDIKARIVRLGLDKNRPFDAAIYGAQQKLRMVGSIKTPQDQRPLKLVDRNGCEVEPTLDLLMDTLVQVVNEDWPLLTEATPRAPKRTATHTPETQLSIAVGEEAVAVAHSAPSADEAALVLPPKRRRGRPRKEDQLPTDLVSTLADKGFRDIRCSKAVDCGWTFDSDNHDATHPCPTCGAVHTSNQFYVNDLDDTFYRIANFSEACKIMEVRKPHLEIIPAAATDVATAFEELNLDLGTPFQGHNRDVHYHSYMVQGAQEDCVACLGKHSAPHRYQVTECFKNQCWTVQHERTEESCPGRIFWYNSYLATYLAPLAKDPKGDAHFADIFAHGHRGVLYGDKNGGEVKYFDTKWRDLSPAQLEHRVSCWLRTLLGQIVRLPEFEQHKPLNEANKHIQRTSVIRGITSQIKTVLAAGEDPKFDTDPYLLGCDNAIIDMSVDPYIIRPPRPEDRVTRSVGYDMRAISEADVAEVEAVMAKIYPVVEEREVMQAYAGYCLLGHVNTKVFMALTDRRKGFNGKSTVVKMFKAAMGDYAVKGKESFLLSTGHVQNMNQHDSGWLDYRCKRLAAFEELESTHKLDMGRLKDVTGGGTTIPVRKAHAVEAEEMEWTAKLMLAFNEGSMPRFDCDDGAFARRMLVMQHRSSFLDADAVAQSTLPHTYLKDEGVLDRMRQAPQKMLAWMLQGVRLYRAGRLDRIPTVMVEWRDELAAEYDDVGEWLAAHVHHQEGAYLRLPALWSEFQRREERSGKVLRRKFVSKALTFMSAGVHTPGNTMRRGEHVSNIIDHYAFTA